MKDRNVYEGSSPRTPDEQIDAALHLLRAAQPEAKESQSPASAFEAMNQRLVRGMRHHATARHATSPRWLPLPGMAWIASALTAACVLAVVVPAFHMHLGPSRPLSSPGSNAKSNPKSYPASPTAHGAPFSVNGKVALAVPTHRLRPSLSVPAPLIPGSATGVTTVAAAPAAPIDPAFLPSFPAPHAPLTPEERLLLSVAHRRPPTMVARLEGRHPGLPRLRVPLQIDPMDPLFSGFAPEAPSPAPLLSPAEPGASSADQPTPVPDLPESAPSAPASTIQSPSHTLNEVTPEPRP